MRHKRPSWLSFCPSTIEAGENLFPFKYVRQLFDRTVERAFLVIKILRNLAVGATLARLPEDHNRKRAMNIHQPRDHDTSRMAEIVSKWP